VTDTQPQSTSQALPDKTDASRPSAKKPTIGKRKKSPNVWPFALLVVLIFALSAVASVYFWQQLEQQNTLIQILTKNSDNGKNELAQRDRVLQQRFQSVDALLEVQTLASHKLKQQSQFNTQQLHDLGARNRADWLMAEAEYLMHLANQRLSFEQDVRSAEAILVSADQVLAENDDPGLLMVRKALAGDILALQQTETADTEGLYVRLSAMINALDRLNTQVFLSQKTDNVPSHEITQTVAVDAAFSWQGLWKEIWKDLQKVFIIKRLDNAIVPLLVPEQSYYIKQNLRLMLEQASLAILDRNQVIYQDSLEKSSLWLNSYFDLTDTSTLALLKQIEAMKMAKINPIIPDISSSLRLLKEKIESMYLNHSLGKLSRPSDEYQRQENKSLSNSTKKTEGSPK
jgi:uroporphyrin-3 C-methyltransferase